RLAPIGIRSVVAAGAVVPTDAEGRARVHLTAPASERSIAAWRILEPGFPASRVRGCVVFVGSSAGRFQDLRATPVSALTPGVEIQANLAEQALLGRFLTRPRWARWSELLFALLSGGGLILLLPRAGALWCGAAAAGVVAASAAASWCAYAGSRALVDPV